MERALRDKLIGGSFGNVSATHSKRMGAIKGRGNRTTEARFRAMLVRAGIRGWKIGNKEIRGKPDFYFSAGRVAVFIDGCFWHGCKNCGHVPSVNRPFWKAKIERNRSRDKEVFAYLLATGVTPVRFWEHDLRNCPTACIQRVQDALAKRANPSPDSR